MPVRGIRGATTASSNTPEAIVEATGELLAELVRLNDVDREELALAWFTTTADLDREYPALAARRMGWTAVPLMCTNDQAVGAGNARSIPSCIRILLLYNTDKAQSEMKSAYLRGAQAIRADLDRAAQEFAP